VDELDADFSGEKVKLTWGVGIDVKKKEFEGYTVGKIYQARPPEQLSSTSKPSPNTESDQSKPPLQSPVTPGYNFPPLESPVPLLQKPNPQHE
jgi:hypothetical protein